MDGTIGREYNSNTLSGITGPLKDTQIATFQVGGELFGIGIHLIREIVRYPDITGVPRAPDYLKGLANLRGNVLPVVDARVRLGLPVTDVTDSSRILVIDAGQGSTGVVVDSVRGVISMENVSVEPPPPLLSSGIDTKFIESVIKAEDARKIIMELDVSTLCAIDSVAGRGEACESRALESADSDKSGVHEIQLVTFLVAREEYGFPIESVKEVLRVSHITEVPEAPPYVMGIFSIRNTLLPVVDIRKLFAISSLVDDVVMELDDMDQTHQRWTATLKQVLESRSSFSGELDHTKCEFGRWLDEFRTSSEEIGKVFQEMRLVHQKYHNVTAAVLEAGNNGGVEEGLKVYESDALGIGTQLSTKFQDLKKIIGRDIKEDQRILVAEIGNRPVGILVDRMQQVIRIPENIIDRPPTILSTERSDNLKGIVKLEEGKHLILLLDENNIIDMQGIDGLKDRRDDMAEDGKISSQSTESRDDEIQLVTFRLGKEEFALGIEDVQEINRLDNITAVPRAPSFVEGVMNLRGNVIPAIDLRRRFEMGVVEHDESSRVIIVNMNGRLTGLIVDSVSEVLRITKKSIEPPPDVISADIRTEFIKGVGKLDGTGRMIILVDVTKILSREEQKQVSRVSERDECRDLGADPASYTGITTKDVSSGEAGEKSKSPETRGKKLKKAR